MRASYLALILSLIMITGLAIGEEQEDESYFEVIETEGPDLANIGEEIELSYVVENKGDEAGNQDIKVEFDNYEETIYRTSMELETNEKKEDSLKISVPEDEEIFNNIHFTISPDEGPSRTFAVNISSSRDLEEIVEEHKDVLIFIDEELNGEIDNSEMREAIDLWREDQIETEALRGAIKFWRTNENYLDYLDEDESVITKRENIEIPVKYDTDNDGRISKEEMRNAIEDWREDELETENLRFIIDLWRTGALYPEFIETDLEKDYAIEVLGDKLKDYDENMDGNLAKIQNAIEDYNEDELSLEQLMAVVEIWNSESDYRELTGSYQINIKDEPRNTVPGKEVSVSFKLENQGDITGNKLAVMKVNDAIVDDTDNLVLQPGQETDLKTLEWEPESEGDYDIEIATEEYYYEEVVQIEKETEDIDLNIECLDETVEAGKELECHVDQFPNTELEDNTWSSDQTENLLISSESMEHLVLEVQEGIQEPEIKIKYELETPDRLIEDETTVKIEKTEEEGFEGEIPSIEFEPDEINPGEELKIVFSLGDIQDEFEVDGESVKGGSLPGRFYQEINGEKVNEDEELNALSNPNINYNTGYTLNIIESDWGEEALRKLYDSNEIDLTLGFEPDHPDIKELVEGNIESSLKIKLKDVESGLSLTDLEEELEKGHQTEVFVEPSNTIFDPGQKISLMVERDEVNTVDQLSIDSPIGSPDNNIRMDWDTQAFEPGSYEIWAETDYLSTQRHQIVLKEEKSLNLPDNDETLSQVTRTGEYNSIPIEVEEGWNLISAPGPFDFGQIEEECNILPIDFGNSMNRFYVSDSSEFWLEGIGAQSGAAIYSTGQCEPVIEYGELEESKRSMEPGVSFISVEKTIKAGNLEHDCKIEEIEYNEKKYMFWELDNGDWKPVAEDEELKPEKGYYANIIEDGCAITS